MFSKKTVRDFDLDGKTVLLHAELDAPLSEDGEEVTSDFRIKSSLPTIQLLLDKKCRVILISKLGRPGGKPNPKMSLWPVAKRLQKLINQPVSFAPDCIGEKVKTAASKLKPGEVLLLENLRFHPEEEQNDHNFAHQIVKDTGAQIFVQDCFALAHRKEAGTDAITRYLPSVAGLSLSNEVETITNAMESPAKPLMAIVGGAKVSDKIEIIKRFIDMADIVALGGALAIPFLVAKGIGIGDSLYDKAELAVAKDVLQLAAKESTKRPFVLAIPHDVVVAPKIDKTAPTRIVELTTHTMADIEHYPRRVPASASTVHAHEKILDIGPFSASFIAGNVQLAKTVIWNGTMGITETSSLQGPIGPTAHGTQIIIEALLGEYGNKPFTVVGGGDTVGYLESRNLIDHFDHVSTGGGASLELMAGHKLPGVEALQDKN